MAPLTYEQFGLTGNPFRDLVSEGVTNVLVTHVNQTVDDTLRTIKEEAADRENHAVVAILGAIGAGKTERLRLADSEARERGLFSVYSDVSERSGLLWRDLAQRFREAAQRTGRLRTFGSPKWLRALRPLEKAGKVDPDPAEVGRWVRTALNATAPSCLLLNDIHNLEEAAEQDAFVRALEEITEGLAAGTLVMFTCYEGYLAGIGARFPALVSRVNRTFVLTPFGDDEAALLVAKKLLAKRVVEDLDPTYPFDRNAVAALNRASLGNPRRLLELADLALEQALTRRSFRIDADSVRELLGTLAQDRPTSPTRPTDAASAFAFAADRAPPSLRSK